MKVLFTFKPSLFTNVLTGNIVIIFQIQYIKLFITKSRFGLFIQPP